MQKTVGHKTVLCTYHYIYNDLSINEWETILTATNTLRANDLLSKVQENETPKEKSN